MTINQQSLPFYGAGVEWSLELDKDLEPFLDHLSMIELIPENFFRQGDDFLEKLASAGTPTVIHGVELSLGSDEPLKEEHFRQMVEVSERINTVMFTEHLSQTESGGVEIGQLTPLNFSVALADKISRKINQVQERVAQPFAIENVTNRFMIPDTEISETDFINQILRQTGCGLQLDLNNVDTNAYNYGYDAKEWIDQLDMSKVVSVHLAGGVFDEEDGTLLDSHNAPVRDRVWDLYRYVTQQGLPNTTIVEWTDNCQGMEILLKDVRIAESILAESPFYPKPAGPVKASTYEEVLA